MADELVEAIILGFLKALPDIVEAFNDGDEERARELAEEAAQREAFKARQRAKRLPGKH